jgi:hypothetical protein
MSHGLSHEDGPAAMMFQNEYVPKLEDVKSEFLVHVRSKLSLGHLSNDKWTVDRANDMALVRTGCGREIDDHDEDYWTFLHGNDTYRFDTKLLNSHELSGKRIYLKRSISFRGAVGLSSPTGEVIQCIKSALATYKDYGVISDYESCELVLINHRGDVL